MTLSLDEKTELLVLRETCKGMTQLYSQTQQKLNESEEKRLLTLERKKKLHEHCNDLERELFSLRNQLLRTQT